MPVVINYTIVYGMCSSRNDNHGSYHPLPNTQVNASAHTERRMRGMWYSIEYHIPLNRISAFMKLALIGFLSSKLQYTKEKYDKNEPTNHSTLPSSR